MSTKYDIPAVRREVIAQLESYLPSDLDGWDNIQTRLYSDPDSVPKDAEFQLLAAARKFDVQSIILVLCYECAINPLEAIFESSDLLGSEDSQRVVIGRERMSKLAYEFGARTLFPQDKCSSRSCSNTRANLLIQWMNFKYYDHPPFNLFTFADGLSGIGDEVLRDKICKACSEKSSTSLEGFREEFWEHMPEVFGLGSWIQLKACMV